MSERKTFESAAARLEEIVKLLEEGGQPLEKSLKLFEEGSGLASFCYRKLADAEQKIRQISELEQKGGKSDGQD
ncbi:MAG TPA: exodeoxyribonuclease VII small subunit [Ruminococcaceae bacterium]|jgi:exodeoxyribonuclease VII small subunit|nr:exodeoxyribonuclease VII small subunit [Oscillospiraceae bacterium]HBQ45672.1 exodeoxyribonuclease VII small subunit [Oscillospiraceae bacterium]HBT90607.1 exodeoxyribonuclease VII small subunit [Oscillospiraceae bacterium]HCB91072.1 exodeoxyribonuclease VII small subunit [Oscillospiraceae bacterium]